MRSRPSSRLLVIDPAGRVLLFRFVHTKGPLTGQNYWSTPGGGLEDGETFEEAAQRELAEETGLQVDDIGTQIGHRQFQMQLPDGEWVMADERYFIVRITETPISTARWTELEREVMAAHRWWSRQELIRTSEVVWPEDLVALLERTEAAS
jgi:8-oxo-dGTP pyrophosphatase MutT (NUDIX family)